MVRFVEGSTGEQIDEPLINPLWQDMVQAESLLKDRDSQFARRCYVRASFAFLEGNLYWLRGVALQRSIGLLSMGRQTSVHEIALLSDETARVDNQGKMKIDSARIPFTNYTAFVLRTMAVTTGHDPKELFSQNGWCKLKDALKVRHRITHPKQPEDLEIRDEDVDALRGGLTWFLNAMRDIAVAGLQADDDRGGE